MKRIASFEVDHDKLQKGLYISRVDGDVVTYDIRMKKPNGGDYLANGAMHTLEHLIATYVRNSRWADAVVYAGPMGCRTGFYLLLRDSVNHTQALELIRSAFTFVAGFEGAIPGVSRRECGNYLEHNLCGAKATAADMLEVLQDWTEEKMDYDA